MRSSTVGSLSCAGCLALGAAGSALETTEAIAGQLGRPRCPRGSCTVAMSSAPSRSLRSGRTRDLATASVAISTRNRMIVVRTALNSADCSAPRRSTWLRATMFPATSCSTACILSILSDIAEYQRAGALFRLMPSCVMSAGFPVTRAGPRLRPPIFIPPPHRRHLPSTGGGLAGRQRRPAGPVGGRRKGPRGHAPHRQDRRGRQRQPAQSARAALRRRPGPRVRRRADVRPRLGPLRPRVPGLAVSPRSAGHPVAGRRPAAAPARPGHGVRRAPGGYRGRAADHAGASGPGPGQHGRPGRCHAGRRGRAPRCGRPPPARPGRPVLPGSCQLPGDRRPVPGARPGQRPRGARVGAAAR